MTTTIKTNGEENTGDVLGHIGPTGVKAPQTRRPWGGGNTDLGDEAYDALTDLFLGEVGPQQQGEAAAAAAPPPRTLPRIEAAKAVTVEALVMGHLPVLSTAWAAQYARTIAEAEAGPVALVQLRAGHATVEIVGDDSPSTIAQADTFARAITAAGNVTNRWIIRADETDEPTLASAPGVRWVTLLTSADEVAVVGAYRAIARLLPKPEDAGSAEDPADSPLVRVAIMGAADDASDAAYAKIASAVRTFIRRPLRRAPGSAKIRSGRAAKTLFSGHVDGDAAALAAMILQPPSSATTPIPAPASSEPNSAAPELKPMPQPVATPTVSHEVPARPAPAAARLSPPLTPPLPTAPAASVAAPPQTVGAMPMGAPLASLIAGLRPLDLRCPHAAEAEFAVDPDGCLHVLVRQSASAAMGIGTDSLLGATAWAFANAALLMRCYGKLRPKNGNIAVVRHAFVDDPRTARSLLDSDLRLHLLVTVTVGGQTVQVGRDLN